jgi:hypothetical protein
MRTTAEGSVWDGRESRQDGPSARTKLLNGAAGSGGPGPGDFDPVTNRSAARRARGRAGSSWVGWTSACAHDMRLTGRGNDSSNGWKR